MLKSRRQTWPILSVAFMGFGHGSHVHASPTVWQNKAGEVSFQSIGKPGFIRINGKTNDIDGKTTWDNGKLEGVYKVPLKDFDTGLSLRDGHMKDKYLEIKKYPDANLVLSPIDWPNKEGETDKPFKGKLTLHGETKDVSGTAKINKTAEKIDVVAAFSILLPDYKIDIPKYTGITVAEKVDIRVQFEANNPKP